MVWLPWLKSQWFLTLCHHVWHLVQCHADNIPFSSYRWPSCGASSPALRMSPQCPWWGTGVLRSLSRVGWWELPSNEAAGACPPQERRPATVGELGSLTPFGASYSKYISVFHTEQWMWKMLSPGNQSYLWQDVTWKHLAFVIITFPIKVAFLVRFQRRRNRRRRVMM